MDAFDSKTVEKINALAKSLKDNHLAANMQEAFEKARDILERSPQKAMDEKHSAEHVPKDLNEEIRTVEELFREEEKAAENESLDLEEIERIEEEVKAEQSAEESEKKEIAAVEEEISKGKEGIGEAREEAEEESEEEDKEEE